MTQELEKVEIEYTADFRANKKAINEIPFIKGINLFIYLIPVLLLAFLTAIFILRIKLLGFSIEAVIWSYIFPIFIYLLIDIPFKILFNRFEKRREVSFQKYPKEVKLVFSEEGINMNALLTDSILDWKYIRKVKQTDNLILFHLAPKLNLFSLPKILVLNAQKTDQLQQLINKKLVDSQIELTYNIEKIKKKLIKIEDLEERE